MSSKRALYKPSPQTNVGHKPKSCLLAQGRLVTDTALKPVVHQVVRSDGDGTKVVEKQDTALTPRKRAPELLEKQSPRPGPPVDKLDLSDSEIDFPQLSVLQSPGDRSRRHQNEVLILDASRQTTEPASAEVDVVVGYEQSPVRVVCHSPGRIRSQTRNASDGLDKWTVQVKGVPKVSFLASTEPSQERVTHGDHSSVDGSVEERHSATKPLFSLHPVHGETRTGTGRPFPTHFPQPNFDDSNGSSASEHLHESKTPIVADMDDAQSVTSESDACSLQDYVTQSKPRIISKQKRPLSNKKKTGRFVPSRYMQSTQLLKNSTSVLPDKSSLSMKNFNQNSSGPTQGSERLGSRKDNSLMYKVSTARSVDHSRSGSGYRSVERPGSARKKKPKSTEERPETPVLPPHKAEGAKTSTPTHDVSSMLLHDASAIHSEMSMLAADVNHSKSSNKGSAQKAPKKTDQPVSVRTLKLLYARYLQSLFLDSQAKMSFKTQEKQEMAEMLELWEAVEEKKKQVYTLRKEITRLKHNILLDEQLELQAAALEPIVCNLPRLCGEHKSLADSLDTTRHQIRTKGIYIPDDEDRYQAMFESALLESEHLLGELSVMTRTATPHTTKTATALQAMESALTAECKEIARCNELVSAIQTLSTEENSLKIHAVQREEFSYR
ncbi:uncharacterized protein LOC121383323 isoform X2 [Gigantopelta aegis]|uniref:uncharacterized protein LOC121383323 isoform X2 n=1 Tax=Gigantopelta aegis TaxID=1735272 RepID=UPI001B88779F|nr:uncharacterized protein LOC121383323 isoform X2 [Gigantopelta aegis]